MPDLGENTNYKFIKDVDVASGQFISYDVHPTFTIDTQVIDKKYVDDSILANGFWDRTGNVLSPFNANDTVLVNLTSSLEENIFEANYTVTTTEDDGTCYAGSVTSSVAASSGQKTVFASQLIPNALDTSGTAYVSFLSNIISVDRGLRTGVLILSGHNVAFAAQSGSMVESVSTVQSIVAANGITDTGWANILIESSTAGDTIITANPAIPDVQAAGHRIRLIGTDDTKTVTLNHGNGVSLDNGEPITLGLNDTLDLVYIGTTWLETSRCIKI